MMKLTFKQVRALRRALKRRGWKLPKVGMCKVISKPTKADKAMWAKGQLPGFVRALPEVCHTREGGKHVYYIPGTWRRR